MSIWTLFCSMGVMTMKMINSTSMTSTMGVTLMLELTLLPSLRTATAIVELRAFEIVFRTSGPALLESAAQRETQIAERERVSPPPRLRFSLEPKPLQLSACGSA